MASGGKKVKVRKVLKAKVAKKSKKIKKPVEVQAVNPIVEKKPVVEDVFSNFNIERSCVCFTFALWLL
mgnify:CR=1 FL=1